MEECSGLWAMISCMTGIQNHRTSCKVTLFMITLVQNHISPNHTVMTVVQVFPDWIWRQDRLFLHLIRLNGNFRLPGGLMHAFQCRELYLFIV